MLKCYVIVFLLIVLMTKKINAKGNFTLTKWEEFDTPYDVAIGSCTRRPSRRSKIYAGYPHVSQKRITIN
jgi:hypothetical protein